MIKKILVVGGTGMLGEPVARRLVADGFQVRVLTRSPEKARKRFGPEFEVVGGDVESVESLRPALEGCQGVHINLDGGFDPDLERRGTVNVLKAAQGLGLKRVTYTSGASVCEENCYYPGSCAKFQAEQAIQASGIPYTIFRDNYFMEVLPNFIRGKLALLIGKHPTPYSWIAVQDYARMVAKSYTMSEAANKLLYVAGPEKLPMRKALEIFRAITHPETRLVYLPLSVARLIAWLGKRRELQAVLPFLEYCETVKFEEHPEEANRLLGAPTTTVEMWSRQFAVAAT